MSEKKSGTVKFFNTRKGYGFVTDSENNTDYFVHTSDVVGNPLQEADNVEFEVGQGNDGRPKAVQVSGGTGDPNAQRFDNNRRGGYGNSGGYNNSYGGNSGGGRFGQRNQGGYDNNQGGSYGGNQGGYGGNSGGFGGRSQEKKICYMWRDHGECRFGTDCRFLHESTN